MIRITDVQGKVVVEDKLNGYNQLAINGLELDKKGNYLIITSKTSSATIQVQGKSINLPNQSFLRIRGNRTWWDSHSEAWNRDIKYFIGLIWSKIANDPRDPGGGSGGGGIRG